MVGEKSTGSTDLVDRLAGEVRTMRSLARRLEKDAPTLGEDGLIYLRGKIDKLLTEQHRSQAARTA